MIEGTDRIVSFSEIEDVLLASPQLFDHLRSEVHFDASALDLLVVHVERTRTVLCRVDNLRNVRIELVIQIDRVAELPISRIYPIFDGVKFLKFDVEIRIERLGHDKYIRKRTILRP
uniref:Uncharacterized protein n=1 Tax=Rhizobium phage LG08 TaxID=3129229 RepID=A0AAU8HY48_9CAUD